MKKKIITLTLVLVVALVTMFALTACDLFSGGGGNYGQATLTFNIGDGSEQVQPRQAQINRWFTDRYYANFDLPILTRDYHVFLGWRFEGHSELGNTSLTGPPTAGATTTSVAIAVPHSTGPDALRNITAIARWAAYHTLSFDMQGASEKAIVRVRPDTSMTFEDGTFGAGSIQAPSDPEWFGHRFDGWFTTASGGASFNFASINESATAYARWTQLSVGEVLSTVTWRLSAQTFLGMNQMTMSGTLRVDFNADETLSIVYTTGAAASGMDRFFAMIGASSGFANRNAVDDGYIAWKYNEGQITFTITRAGLSPIEYITNVDVEIDGQNRLIVRHYNVDFGYTISTLIID